jgi:ribonuclease HII
MVAAAVVLKQPIAGLTDSKLIKKLRREELAAQIKQSGARIGIGWVEPAIIDAEGLTTATRLAMEAALKQIDCDYDEIVIDGTYNFLAGVPQVRTEAKADLNIAAVSAASIVAKVARDGYMAKICKEFPDYGFDKHVGYGTRLHLEKLMLHGPCRLHRLSYRPVAALIQ